jgi:dGTPase
MKVELQTREQFEKAEYKFLAPYAMKSADSQGRKHNESEHNLRSAFQRDRDRIIHCNAFRRLEYKTQVFVIHEDDYFRTRLTHTIEVAQVARSLARNLRLNEDLTEAIALAHDLGHTPFGHSGEEVLNRLMRAHGKFEHNKQSLRIVTKLEKRYPSFDGLNLTYEVTDGLDKHKSDYDQTEISGKAMTSMEAQIVNLSDEIAYHTHDLDDGIKSKLINIKDLNEIPICKELLCKIDAKEDEVRRYELVKLLINYFCRDLITQTLFNLDKHSINSISDVEKAKSKIVSFSVEMNKKKKELREFLFTNLYKHHRVVRMEVKHQTILEELFGKYVKFFEHNPSKGKYSMLPLEIRSRVSKEDSKFRVICDHIANMTDRYALDEHKKLFDPSEKV